MEDSENDIEEFITDLFIETDSVDLENLQLKVLVLKMQLKKFLIMILIFHNGLMKFIKNLQKFVLIMIYQTMLQIHSFNFSIKMLI